MTTHVATEFVVLTSISLSSNLYYSGNIVTLNAKTGVWTTGAAVLVETPNGETPQANVRYPSRVVGFLNGQPVMMLVMTNQCPGSGSQATGSRTSDLAYIYLGNVGADPGAGNMAALKLNGITVEAGELLVVGVATATQKGTDPTVGTTVTFAGTSMTAVANHTLSTGQLTPKICIEVFSLKVNSLTTGIISVTPYASAIQAEVTAAALQGLTAYATDVSKSGGVNGATTFDMGSGTTAHANEIGVAFVCMKGGSVTAWNNGLTFGESGSASAGCSQADGFALFQLSGANFDAAGTFAASTAWSGVALTWY